MIEASDETWKLKLEKMRPSEALRKSGSETSKHLNSPTETGFGPGQIGFQTTGTWTSRYKNVALILRQHKWPLKELSWSTPPVGTV